MELRVIILCILIKFNFIKSHKLAVKIEIPLGEIEIPSSKSNETLKSALRYGFHRTQECQDYAKAYICIQKCIDLSYDIAYSNKKCKCFCITKKEKAKYTPSQMFTRTKWKLGAPSTTRPAWVEKYKMKSDKKKADKKLVDKLTVTEEPTKAINCTAANNSDSCQINSNNIVESNINSNENKLNDSNATSAVETPYITNVSSSEIETPSKNSANSSAAEISTKTSENSSVVQTLPKNSENSTLTETPSKNSINSSEVEDPSKNSGNSSAANTPSKNNDNSSAVGNNDDNSNAVEIPTKNNANSPEVVDPHKSSSNSSEVEPPKNSANAPEVELPQKNSANSPKAGGSSNNK